MLQATCPRPERDAAGFVTGSKMARRVFPYVGRMGLCFDVSAHFGRVGVRVTLDGNVRFFTFSAKEVFIMARKRNPPKPNDGGEPY